MKILFKFNVPYKFNLYFAISPKTLFDNFFPQFFSLFYIIFPPPLFFLFFCGLYLSLSIFYYFSSSFLEFDSTKMDKQIFSTRIEDYP